MKQFSIYTIFPVMLLLAGVQQNSRIKSAINQGPRKASFITVVDSTQATKDGIYMNGYVVNIGYEKIIQLQGKRVKVTGRVSIVKAVKNEPGKPVSQGRETDTKYIDKPRIEILKD